MGVYGGELEERILFFEIKSTGLVVAAGADRESGLCCDFLSGWTIECSASDLLSVILGFKSGTLDLDEIDDIRNDGICVSTGNRMKFVDEGVVFESGDPIAMSSIIEFDVVTRIVRDWVKFVSLPNRSDCVYNAGHFYYRNND